MGRKSPYLTALPLTALPLTALPLTALPLTALPLKLQQSSQPAHTMPPTAPPNNHIGIDLELLIDDTFLANQMEIFNTLRETIPWEGSMAARRTASFGVPYNYAQMTYPAVPMHPALIPVVEQLHHTLNVKFNNCLLNYYETGKSKMGFHSDDTTHLQPNTGVAIVSLGHPRKITYRSKTNKTLQHAFALRPGSLLYMSADLQKDWVHAIKRQKDVGPRISLTWRAFNE